jgi:hypothetical protein
MALTTDILELAEFTTVERDALNPNIATLIYNTTVGKLQMWNGAWIDLPSAGVNEWFPPSISMGSILTSGGSGYFINGGAGVYLGMPGNDDSEIYVNDSLNRGGAVMYDGSDLALVFKCRIASNGGGGNTIGLIVDYQFVKNGDISTVSTTINQQNTDVSTKLQDEQFEIQLPTMQGVVDAETIMITVQRNSQGAGGDGYSGAFEILSMRFEKV